MQWNKAKLNRSTHMRWTIPPRLSLTPVCRRECVWVDWQQDFSTAFQSSKSMMGMQQSLWLLMIVRHSWTEEDAPSLGSRPHGSGTQMRWIYSGDLWLSSSGGRPEAGMCSSEPNDHRFSHFLRVQLLLCFLFSECLFTLSANSPSCWQRLFTLTLPTNVWSS